MSQDTTNQTIHLTIELLDMPYPIMRRIGISEAATLADLHRVIQIAMPFTNSHLHQFDVPAPMSKGSRKRPLITRYGTPDPDGWMDVEDENDTKLRDLVAKGVKSFIYIYDFGDNWEHAITIDATDPTTSEQGFAHLVEAQGRAPPDDCGGAPGFEAFVDAMTNAKHEDHADLANWYGQKTFNPANVPTKSIQAQLAKIKPKPKRKSPNK
ncbi:MAG: plasmid pRiA4b ORF-3 family protein [Hyphomonadaceae bacterium]|jgi:hypothetical protein|uniref:plasmid pRiA4b ORF-3 family protein n=1 Tax=Aquidulcibacter sp. TaxID=2052990 RepID=UPI0022BAC1A1|nr:plasmid pRiA4b ORF-3 family protein [Aquidulcibacter sp.]MCE2889917.1 plasmid pRiA4b ORF-3 family protein [Hyphomonadaceae bacterium]MCZ8209160.1 plasmid pRiA4b ORF-3 family protein [Aquidulcibacter sp.]